MVGEIEKLEVGDWVFIWGAHRRVHAVRDGHVQIVPEGRKPHPFDWTSIKRVQKFGRPSSKED
jgi:hypothetical protein